MHQNFKLRGVVLPALFVFFLSIFIPLHATATDAHSEWVQNLRRWLDLAYSESDNYAGFGDLDADQITAPNLYITRGAVQILYYLGVKVKDPQPIGVWINSLVNDQGAYDDPLNHAPLLLETYWAVTTLRTLGIPACEPAETINFILSLQGDDGLFHYDQFIDNTLWDNISCTDVVLTILQCLGAENLPQVKPALDRAADRVAEAVNSLLGSVNGDWRKFDEKETENFESGWNFCPDWPLRSFQKREEKLLRITYQKLPLCLEIS